MHRLCTGYAQVMHRCAYFLCTVCAQVMHRCAYFLCTVCAQLMHTHHPPSTLVAKMISTPEYWSSFLPPKVLIATYHLLGIRLITSPSPDFQQMCIFDSCPRCYRLPKLLLLRERYVRFHHDEVTWIFQYQVVMVQFHLHFLLPPFAPCPGGLSPSFA